MALTFEIWLGIAGLAVALILWGVDKIFDWDSLVNDRTHANVKFGLGISYLVVGTFIFFYTSNSLLQQSNSTRAQSSPLMLNSSEVLEIVQVIASVVLAFATVGLIMATKALSDIQILPHFEKHNNGGIGNLSTEGIMVYFRLKGNGLAEDLSAQALINKKISVNPVRQSTDNTGQQIGMNETVDVNESVTYFIPSVKAQDNVVFTLRFRDMKGRKQKAKFRYSVPKF